MPFVGRIEPLSASAPIDPQEWPAPSSATRPACLPDAPARDRHVPTRFGAARPAVVVAPPRPPEGASERPHPPPLGPHPPVMAAYFACGDRMASTPSNSWVRVN